MIIQVTQLSFVHLKHIRLQHSWGITWFVYCLTKSRSVLGGKNKPKKLLQSAEEYSLTKRRTIWWMYSSSTQVLSCPKSHTRGSILWGSGWTRYTRCRMGTRPERDSSHNLLQVVITIIRVKGINNSQFYYKETNNYYFISSTFVVFVTYLNMFPVLFIKWTLPALFEIHVLWCSLENVSNLPPNVILIFSSHWIKVTSK